MAKLACFLMLLLVASVFELQVAVEVELPRATISRKMLSKPEVLISIINFPVNNENVACAQKGEYCSVYLQCCDPYHCTQPVIGGICA
uniref:Alpha amylase inhibitor Wrightide R1 n=2 Tax=Wrightia religiosa TaxID=429305 RepID=V5W9K8_9GENT|nr:alpha amylase inhibitor precursor Wrightide R1 [Wrightia religiosa]